MSDSTTENVNSLVNRNPSNKKKVNSGDKGKSASDLFTHISETLPTAPKSLVEFLMDVPEEERKNILNQLRFASTKDILEYDNRRKWIQKKYPHAFTEKGLTSKERLEIAMEFDQYEPVVSPQCKAQLVGFLIVFILASVVAYSVAGINSFEYIGNMLLKRLQPTFPSDK